VLPKEEGLPAVPISPYSVGKLAAEGYCRAFFQVYGLETVALRYFNVFGPPQEPLSDYAAVIPRFNTAMHAGKRPLVYGDGEQSRDFTFVDNAVDANLQASQAEGVAGQAFNVAGGERITLNALLAELRGIIGSDVEPEYADARPGDVRHSLADIGRARSALGYEPAVGLREGLQRTVESLKSRP
jgi:nucleoside-diphosphate-sugar epimerase